MKLSLHLSMWLLVVISVAGLVLFANPRPADAQVSVGCRSYGWSSIISNAVLNNRTEALLGEISSGSRFPECRSDEDKASLLQRIQQQQQSTTQRLADAQKPSEPVTCTAWYHFLWPTCMWRGAMIALGTTLISLAAWLLAAAGILFNFALQWGIVEFAVQVFEPLRKAVELGWTLFRDIGNIVIIGVFTYVAISMILNNQTFGTKQMVAKVLVVAVLINFSLLFSKLVIDASHFVSHQFYRAALSQVASPTPTTSTGASGINPLDGYTSSGIAGQFVKLTGLSGAWSTWGSLQKLSNNVQSGWITLLYGIMITVFVGVAAALLLFATFLLAARTVLLIILMATSALAFAALLIPKQIFQDGWSKWLESLLRSAMFAPMLLFMLWFTLTVGNHFQKGSASLATFVDNPTNSDGLAVVFGYLIMIGLLYASMRLASQFSTSVGANIATRLTSGAFTLPIGAALARYTQFRQKKAYERANEDGENIKLQRQVRLHAFQNGDSAAAAASARELKRLQQSRDANVRASKRDLNFFNNKGISSLMKSVVGTSGLAAGQVGKTTYEEKAKGEGKKLEERFASSQISKEERDKIRKEALDTVPPHIKETEQYKALATEREQKVRARDEAARKTKDAVADAASDESRAKTAFTEQKRNIEGALAETRKNIKEAADQLRDASDEGTAQRLRATLDRLKVEADEHASQLQSETEKHEAALEKLRQGSQEKLETLRATEKSAREEVTGADERIKKHVQNVVDQSFVDYDKMLKSQIEEEAGDKNIAAIATKNLNDREKKAAEKRAYQALVGDQAKTETTDKKEEK